MRNPTRSRATNTFLNVGGSSFSTISWRSFVWAFMPSSKADRKCDVEAAKKVVPPKIGAAEQTTGLIHDSGTVSIKPCFVYQYLDWWGGWTKGRCDSKTTNKAAAREYGSNNRASVAELWIVWTKRLPTVYRMANNIKQLSSFSKSKWVKMSLKPGKYEKSSSTQNRNACRFQNWGCAWGVFAAGSEERPDWPASKQGSLKTGRGMRRTRGRHHLSKICENKFLGCFEIRTGRTELPEPAVVWRGGKRFGVDQHLLDALWGPTTLLTVHPSLGPSQAMPSS